MVDEAAKRAIVAPRATMKSIARRHRIGNERRQTQCPELVGWDGLVTHDSMHAVRDGDPIVGYVHYPHDRALLQQILRTALIVIDR